MKTERYEIIHSSNALEKAREQGEGHLLILGDSGGETFVTCPMPLIQCKAENLFLLMLDLEALDQVGRLSKSDLGPDVSAVGYDAWVVWVDYEIGVICQNGVITEGLWVDDDVERRGLKAEVEAVLSGRISRLSGSGKPLEW